MNVKLKKIKGNFLALLGLNNINEKVRKLKLLGLYDNFDSSEHKIESSSETNNSQQLKTKKKCRCHDKIYGELKKIKPPMFNGEIETEEEVEDWLSKMKKYFLDLQLFSELKAKMAIYNFIGKSSIWW